MDQLYKLGFTESANITYDTKLNINFSRNENATNILYAFVLIDGEDIASWKVLYIGHTRKSFKNRMYGYQRGNGNGVNNRLHELIKGYVKGQQKEVKVYCFTDVLNLMIKDIELDLAAGLEYSLINYYAEYNEQYGHSPLINIAGNKNFKSSRTEKLEELIKTEKVEEDEDYQVQNDLILYDKAIEFPHLLGDFYWNNPFFNIPSKYADCFGDHGDTAVFHFYKNNILLKSIPVNINRNAVTNHSPRFYFSGMSGKWFQEWKHQNFTKGSTINVNITAKNNLAIYF